MQMIDNYLNSLESYLPDDLKQDVREELEASIYDQIEELQEELNRDLTQMEQEKILLNIGHPMQVASRYLPNQKLISESFFPAYKKALKIAILIMFSIKVLLSLPSLLSNGNIILSVTILSWDLLNTAFWVFAYVTGIFYLMERFGFNVNYLYSFSAKDLQYNSPKLALSRVETAFELLFLIIFLAWWNKLFSWVPPESLKVSIIHTSMSPEWQAVFWSVNIVLSLDVLNCLYNFIRGSFNRITLIVGIVLNIASVVILSQISRFSKFVTLADTNLNDVNWVKLEPVINMSIYILLVVILIINLWELVSSFRKLRYFNGKI